MNYADLGFNQYMERPLMTTGTEMAADDFESSLESGAITGDMLAKAIIGSDALKDEIIKNTNIQVISRSATAIVTTDSTGTHGNIQDAVNYVHNKGGGTVYIRAGTYKINYNIKLYTKVKLVGDGPGETILDFANSNYNINLLGTLTELSLLTAYSDKAWQNVEVKNLSIKNCYNDNGAIYIQYVRSCLIENCLFKNCDQAIQLQSCLPATVRGNTIYSSEAQGVLVSGGFAVIKDNYFGGHDTGVKMESGNGICANNFFVDGATSSDVTIAGGNFYVISGNQFQASDNAAITLTRSSGGGDLNHPVIVGNTFYGSSYADGVLAYDASVLGIYHVTIESNNFYGLSYGVRLAYANYTRIIGNSMDACNVGIRINNSCNRTLTMGNNCYTCTTKITDLGVSSTTVNNIIS